MIRLLELTYENLVAAFAKRYEKGPSLAAAAYREFYKQLNPEAWTAKAIGASPGLTDRLRKDLAFTPGSVVEETHQDGVVKFITRLGDGHRIESVILPMETRHTVCLSSQVGCRMGCRFCETGRLGLVRDLTVEEIVGQVYAVRSRFGKIVRNVVFMGMGEPFDNFDAVIQAIKVLSDQRGMNIARRYMTVSTAGRIDGIEKLGAMNMPHLKLVVSLNAPNDKLRAELMPINNAAPLDALQKALMAYPLKKGYDIMIAYVLIPGINDSPDCCRQLADWLAPLRAKVNLIPFNPGTEALYRSPAMEEIDTFRNRLIAMGVNVQKRLPRGRDLMAACGQLSNGAMAG
jgi:23S rRNA (adenine2503-C2)-methyltransferase